MPYQKKSELPDAVKSLPPHAQEIWMEAFNSAFEQYKGDEEKAFATAWAAIKTKYKKEGDKWTPISSGHSGFPEWIEVFAAGTWTDSAGETTEWMLDDLKEIASTYDFKNNPVPIVIGHPDTDSPAYGWIEALKVEGEKLLAKPTQLIEEFVDWVKRGLYKKISVAIYPDLKLKHVGFLGGTAPAVKGLSPVAFGNKKAGWTFEKETSLLLGESASQPDRDGIDNPKKGGKKMTLKEFIEKMRGLFSEAEKDFSDPEHSREAKFTESEVQAREAKVKAEVEKLAFAENERLKKEKADTDAKLKEIGNKAKKDEIAAFCEAQCKSGKLTPALRKIIEPVMISVMDSGQIEFAEGVKKTPLDGIKDFLNEIPKVVTFKEVTPSDGPAAGGTAGEKLTVMTKKKMDEKKDLTYRQAFSEVQSENPELAKEYALEVRPAQK